MLNTEYDREFVFDIDAYLIEWYPSMDMKTRRSVCAKALDYFDTEELETLIDEVISIYAKEQLKITKKEIDEDQLDD